MTDTEPPEDNSILTLSQKTVAVVILQTVCIVMTLSLHSAMDLT